MTTPGDTMEGPDTRPAKIAVVLVNWNGWQDTVEACRSVQASSLPDIATVVVDNASTDGSVDRLRALDLGIHLIENTLNAGFAGGCNLGAAHARALGATHIYFLNNDAVVAEDTVARLLEASRALGDKAVLGTTIRFASDGRLQFLGSQRVGSGPRWRPPTNEFYEQAPDLIPSDFVMGASLFAPIEVMNDVGAFEERYFLNYEETDWCYRAARLGFPSLVVKRAVIYHKAGASIGDLQGPMQVYFLNRNRLLFVERNASPLRSAAAWARLALKTVVGLPGRIYANRSRPALFDPGTHATLLALRDYALRRFGDCPPIVRRLAQDHRLAGSGA